MVNRNGTIVPHPIALAASPPSILSLRIVVLRSLSNSLSPSPPSSIMSKILDDTLPVNFDLDDKAQIPTILLIFLANGTESMDPQMRMRLEPRGSTGQSNGDSSGGSRVYRR